MKTLFGTLPALLTPYNADKSINADEFVRMCRWGIEHGLNGLFCNGSAGDSQAQTYEQKLQMLRLSVQAAKGDVPVICGIGSCCYAESLAIADEAHKAGADALLLMMPYYYKFDDATLAAYVRELASSVKLPLYIYNIPLFAPAMSLNLIAELAAHANIVGIKDSSGDALLLNHILDRVPEDFAVFVGREEHYFGALMMGAAGSMTSCGCVFPDAMSAIYAAFKAGDFERAKRIQMALLPAIRFGMSMAFPQGFALLLKARGFAYGEHSIHPLSDATKQALKERYAEAQQLVRDIEAAL